MKVLLGWQMGGGQGHLQRLAQLAEKLELAGIEPVFALKSDNIKGQEFPWQCLPCPPLKFLGGERSFHFAEILATFGFADPNLLRSYLQAWRKIIAQVKPKLIIADGSSALVLAAHNIIPTIVIGNGFAVPPPVEIFPILDCPFPAKSVQYQAQVSQTIRQVIKTDAPIGKILNGDISFIYCLPALDPYQHLRPYQSYVGIQNAPLPPHLYRQDGAAWAYLKSKYPFYNLVLETLKPQCEFQPLQEALAGKSLAIHHGGCTTAIACLLAGIPQLILPYQLEQKITALKLSQLGVAMVSAPPKPEALLAMQAQSHSLAACAQLQSEKFQHWNQNFTEVIINRCLQLKL